ncbi:unnamed protein product [Thlaspi arvense]|uniref:Uncharacterized protein n=1 Tax=Thlaspi arvense TaxID=13288 RepID=A0AAU9S3Y4_THLAR|nr:unnamed protein product [Thlaspi arvense]
MLWQKLEEENREFFKAYYLRLMVKHQIMEFNKLLEQQVHHMQQMHPSGVTSVQNTNGSHIQSKILESYDKSPFLAPEAENFLDSCDRGEYQGDNKRLETISEGFSYENLGSE